jgi:cyclophilin family peptidyl-prolyl cis-trans isomerase
MAKRRRPPARPPEIQRAATYAAQRRTGPRRQAPPPSSRQNRNLWYAAAGIGAVIVLAVLAYTFKLIPGVGGVGGSTTACTVPAAGRPPGPPDVSPLSNPPSQPVSDGTTATIVTEKGTITFDLYCGSSPVAAQNFVNLASAGFYDGLTFHRIMPNFVIQGGDPNGNGSGGPGYTIKDEPVVGTYGRGIVAMARTGAPNSAGSQFFIVVSDQARNALQSANTYAIFGKVTSGMDVADQIVSGPSSGGEAGTALDPVTMTKVTVQKP